MSWSLMPWRLTSTNDFRPNLIRKAKRKKTSSLPFFSSSSSLIQLHYLPYRELAMTPDLNQRDPFTPIPVELISRIFCHLPTFQDAFAFAAASHQIQNAWSEDVSAIYESISPRTIQCRRYARVRDVSQPSNTWRSYLTISCLQSLTTRVDLTCG